MLVLSALKRNKYVGFNIQDEGQDYKDMKGKVMEELKRAFRPEFLNRIDETIVFHSLEKKHLKEIVTLMADQLIKRLKEQEIDLELQMQRRKKLPKKDMIQNMEHVQYAEQFKNMLKITFRRIVKRKYQKGQNIVIDVENGELAIRQPEAVNVHE